MTDTFPKEVRSKIMAKIRSKDTKCELVLRHALWQAGIRGFKRHYRITGEPDFAFLDSKIAVFCDSEFWHGLRGIPHSNRDYWTKKLRRNRARDLTVNTELRRAGWKVIRLRESWILADPEKAARKIKTLLS